MCNLCGRAPAKLHQAESVLYWGISINTKARTDCQECWGFHLRQTLTHSILFHDLQSIFTPMISFSHPKGTQGRQVRGRHPAFLAGETEAETGAGPACPCRPPSGYHPATQESHVHAAKTEIEQELGILKRNTQKGHSENQHNSDKCQPFCQIAKKI